MSDTAKHTPGLIEVLRNNHGNFELRRSGFPIAFVVAHKDNLGNVKGWRVIPNSAVHRPSRKTWLTPDNAIASMRYMTNSEARAVIAKARGEVEP